MALSPLASTRLLIVGNGRVAQMLPHLSFDHSQVVIGHWHRGMHEPFAQCVASFQPTHIALAISDHALESFLHEHYQVFAVQPHCTLVHFAGRFGRIFSDDLTITIYPAHPLMSFADIMLQQPHSVELVHWNTMPFVLSNEGKSLHELLPTLPNPSFAIPDEMRTYYHALCTALVSITVLTWETAEARCTDILNLPATILHPYREQIMKNLSQRQKHESVLTGAIARKDKSTIVEHLQTLQRNGDAALAELYKAAFHIADPSHTLPLPTSL